MPDDGDFALVVDLFEEAHAGVEAEAVVEGYDLVFLDADVFPVVAIMRVTVGHDAVQVVVAA